MQNTEIMLLTALRKLTRGGMLQEFFVNLDLKHNWNGGKAVPD